MKQIAVVIPLYNHAAYIGDAIRSVLAQTQRVDKIVIVDDGSTDDSVEIVRAFAEPRIELYTQPNAGAHVALNRGIENAAGCDYAAILNSDDVFARERISICVAFLDETPAIDVVATRLKLIDSTGSEMDPLTQPPNGSRPRGRSVHHNWTWSSSSASPILLAQQAISPDAERTFRSIRFAVIATLTTTFFYSIARCMTASRCSMTSCSRIP
jgi:glycosyltransferase involved in cell wall biosynthesis